jgi:hypothetical protein
MKAVHAASVAGTAGVEAAARAIKERLQGQLQPNSSVAPVARQKHLLRLHRGWVWRLHRKWAQQFIHPKRRRRRAGTTRLRHL